MSSNFLPEMIHSHTSCICWAFLQCVFSCVSSNCLREMLHNHNGCICLTFLQCVFLCVSSNDLPEMMHSHKTCICLIFLFCLSLLFEPENCLVFYSNLVLLGSTTNITSVVSCVIFSNWGKSRRHIGIRIERTEIES